MYTAKGYVVVTALGFKAIDIMSNFPHGVTSLFYWIRHQNVQKYLVLVFFCVPLYMVCYLKMQNIVYICFILFINYLIESKI